MNDVRRVLADGCFDPLHGGHLDYLQAAACLGETLIVNVAPDAVVAQKHPPLLSQAERQRLVGALSVVDQTVAKPTLEALRSIKPCVYVKGKDWEGKIPDDQLRLCSELGIAIAFTNTVSASSTALLRQQEAARLQAFENLVLSQQPASKAWEPVTDYSFEARKAIEGKHPELIHEVFRPRLVLDAGCGPGHLVVLLLLLGVPAYGVDVRLSREALSLLFEGDLCDERHPIEWDLPYVNYDLVICREVLEHLTVRQIRQAVVNLCRLSSRFVYVTTRFHPQPQHLLDVATSDDLDPTHISMLSQDFLRVLFVLEGFKRRADLEQRMDWMNKGRVLVYERT